MASNASLSSHSLSFTSSCLEIESWPEMWDWSYDKRRWLLETQANADISPLSLRVQGRNSLSQHNPWALLLHTGGKKRGRLQSFLCISLQIVWTTVFILETFRNCACVLWFWLFLCFFLLIETCLKDWGQAANFSNPEQQHKKKPQTNVFTMQTVVHFHFSNFVLECQAVEIRSGLAGISCKLLIHSHETRFTQHREANVGPVPRRKV